MTNFGNKDWLIEVEQGNVPGYSIVHKFGKNPAVGTGAIEDIWYAGGLYAWPTAAATLEAISTSGNDTNAAGTGARVVTVQGLTIAGAEISEDINMAGLVASSATSASFFRVSRAFVKTSGTYATGVTGSHAGTITIRVSGAGATQATIPLEGALPLGQTQIARYTVPASKKAFLLTTSVAVSSKQDALVYFQVREDAATVAAPFAPRKVRLAPPTFSGVINQMHHGAGPYTGIADMWWSSIADAGGAADVSINFEILLIDI